MRTATCKVDVASDRRRRKNVQDTFFELIYRGKIHMEKENLLFTNRQLKNMILPLLMEQFLLMLVGLADTFVVSYVGEAAVSGVSLVNSFNTIFLFLFTALASGGQLWSVSISEADSRKMHHGRSVSF